MSRFPLIALFVLGTVLALACSHVASPTTPSLNAQVGNPENHVAWGVFDVVFDLEKGSAQIVWNRQAEMHLNCTAAVTPPKCWTCVQVVDSSYNPNSCKFYLQVAFTNPTKIVGYDVRAVISNPGGNKFLLNPDGMTSIWGSPMQFKAVNIDPERTFGAYEVHGRMFEFYFPPQEKWATMTYILDASWPTYTDEPLIENGASDPVVNNGFATTFVRAHVFDHQGDLNGATVMADLMSLGGSPQTTLYDDGQHNDLAPGDGTFGSLLFTTKADIGVHMVNVYAMDTTGHMGWGQVAVYVQKTAGGPNEDPVIDEITRDRTTANGGANEKIKITVSAHDPDGTDLGYEYTAGSGSFTGQNDNYVYWKPSSTATGPVNIGVKVIDILGGEATGQIKVWSTDLSVVNGSTQGMVPQGTLQSLVPQAMVNMAQDFVGEVLYCNFWATWCPYCVQELPELNGVYNNHKDNPEYNHVYINEGEDETTVLNFLGSYDYEATFWVMDPDGSYFDKCNDFNGGSNGIPQHVLFDRDGRCRWAHIGGLSSTSELEAAISQLL